MSKVPLFQFALRDDLSEDFVPRQGTPLSTGWDVRAAFADGKDLIIRAGRHIKIPLGFRVLAPTGWWLELRPRSSTFAKRHLHALYGVIDEDYEGECIFACQYLPDATDLYTDLTIAFGDAIGQIVPVKRQIMEVRQISNEEFAQKCKERSAQRGAGGFGSTGS
jgi:dUTPase